MPMNPYETPDESPSLPTPRPPFPTLANRIHSMMIGVLALVMCWQIVEAPEDVIGVFLFCGFFWSLPYICSLVGAMGATLVGDHSFTDRFRRYLELFLIGMILHNLMVVGFALFSVS